MTQERRVILTDELKNAPDLGKCLTAIGLILLQIAHELSRLAETQEEAHK